MLDNTQYVGGFVGACLKYFGKHPGQSLKEFRDELSALTDKDRADLTAMFATISYVIQ